MRPFNILTVGSGASPGSSSRPSASYRHRPNPRGCSEHGRDHDVNQEVDGTSIADTRIHGSVRITSVPGSSLNDWDGVLGTDSVASVTG
jgi:hypothetical protein